MLKLKIIFPVTLCATVFFSCGSNPPKPMENSSELASGEETAKSVADDARKAEKEGNTGIHVDSSKDQTSKSPDNSEPESQPTETQPAKSTPIETISVRFGDGKFIVDGNAVTKSDLLKLVESAHQKNPKLTVIFHNIGDELKTVEAELKSKNIRVERASSATTQPTK